MTNVYAVVLPMRSMNDASISQDMGQWANAAFYTLLRQIAPELTETLHNWNGRKPFTVSLLYGSPHLPKDGSMIFRAGWECGLRVTLLGEQLFHAFIQYFLRNALTWRANPLQVQLGPLTFVIQEVLTTAAAHEWAGASSCVALYRQSSPATHLRLDFVTPASFNFGEDKESGVRHHYQLFPQPDLIFDSLARQWQTVAPAELALPPQWVSELARRVRVADYELRTFTLQRKNNPQKGFQGTCAYDLRALAPQEQQVFTLLADFAFYTGVGGKTTQGLGQCRRR